LNGAALIALGGVMKNLVLGTLIAIGASFAAHAADMPKGTDYTSPN
jgi:hypothetical protein